MTMYRMRRKETLIALLGVVGIVAAAAITFTVLRDEEARPPAAAPTTTSPPPTTTTTAKKKPPSRLPAALVVKIDNVTAARPHVGLSSADAIFVEPVEGGLTRLLAVYWGKRPSVVGPVRSARQTDIELLAQLKKPVLAYSGAASQLGPALRKANLVLASPKSAGGAFWRNNGRPKPHNMFVSPRRLPSTKRVSDPLPSGKAPSGGKRRTELHVSYRSASYDFRWSKGSKSWLVSMDGTPMVSAGRGKLKANTVVVQRVRIERGVGISDAAEGVSPFARTVGKGKATMLRDGKIYQGTWSRSKAKRQTTYRTSDGERLPLGKGKVWVLLVPS